MNTKSATRKGVPPLGSDKLTPKQVRFIDEYLVDLNARQAAIRAGYSKKTAAEAGYENLNKPHIALAVEAKRKEVAAGVGITRERVLREMAAIAFSDVRKLFVAGGGLTDATTLGDDIAPAIASIKLTSFTPPGDDAEPEYTKEIKFWDKGKALEGLLKHLGMEGDKPAGATSALPGLDALMGKLAARFPEHA